MTNDRVSESINVLFRIVAGKKIEQLRQGDKDEGEKYDGENVGRSDD